MTVGVPRPTLHTLLITRCCLNLMSPNERLPIDVSQIHMLSSLAARLSSLAVRLSSLIAVYFSLQRRYFISNLFFLWQVINDTNLQRGS